MSQMRNSQTLQDRESFILHQMQYIHGSHERPILTHGDLFSGIGGFALAAKWNGLQTLWAVEIDEYCQKVYSKHFPDVEMHSDVKAVTRLQYVDLLTAGFPCQAVSLAGKRLGVQDERWLWPETLRCLRLVRPRWALLENVPGLLGRGMAEIQADLAASGYDAEWESISAAAVGAPHIRDRVWIVAWNSRRGSDGEGCGQNPGIYQGTHTVTPGICQDVPYPRQVGGGVQPFGFGERKDQTDADDDGKTQSVAYPLIRFADWWPRGVGWWTREPEETLQDVRRDRGEEDELATVKSPLGRVAHGIPKRVDRLRALGNAIVPQVAWWIIRQIVNTRGRP